MAPTPSKAAAAPRAEPALAAESGSVGERLHLEVPAERWCVTREDLRQLRRQVQEALRDGQIVPTEQDDFDLADCRVGPSVYTVTEQFIKPVTAEAGGMSWALMRHPKGLKCGLFITHAWMEGIYELIDKVLSSWPCGCKHAWCCVLAMPQNCSISSLIRYPKDSPFARALACAPQMLVVPNQRGSIYSRLWCAYEAFLAQQQKKIILTAIAPHLASCVKAMLAMAMVVAAVMAAVIAAVALGDPHKSLTASDGQIAWFCDKQHRLWHARDGQIAWFLVSLLVVLSLVVGSQRLRLLVNFMGAVCSAYAFVRHSKHMPHFVVYFVVAELDRIRAWAAKDESKQLACRSVRDAVCFDMKDKERIVAEIDGQEGDVDHAISVLIRAKMSTPLLCGLARAGVEVMDAGRREWAFTIAMMFRAPLQVYWAWVTYDHRAAILHAQFMAFVQFAWAILVISLPRDRQALAMRAQQKVAVLYYSFTSMLKATAVAGLMDREMFRRYDKPVHVAAWFLILAVSACPPEALVKIPAVGPGLVQFLIGRSLSGGAQHSAASCCFVARRSISSSGAMPTSQDAEADVV